MDADKKHKVPLSVSNKQALVWNVQDIAKLRTEHRICGLLGGTLPHLSQQNVFLGVPLILMPEEVVLLVENEVAYLVDDTKAHHEPDSDEKIHWEEEQNSRARLQLAQKAKAKELEGISPNNKSTSEEAMRKRREREERKAAALLTSQDQSKDDDLSASITEDAVGKSLVENGRQTPSLTAKLPSEAYAVTIPTSSNTVSWYHSEAHAFHTLDAARESGIWLYPSTLEERARCGVFRSLWEKGYYLGCGIRFGGEFVVYPGDLLRYHSHFVATVHTSPESPLRPMEIVAHGRLGTATKKAHLLCTWDDKTKTVDILSIEWSGFG